MGQRGGGAVNQCIFHFELLGKANCIIGNDMRFCGSGCKDYEIVKTKKGGK